MGPKKRQKVAEESSDSAEEGSSAKQSKVIKVLDSNSLQEIIVEHCKSWQVYKKKANEYVDFLHEHFPKVPESINAEKPRSKAFNISVKINDKVTEVWDGRSKGPPRKEKWPDKEELLKKIEALL